MVRELQVVHELLVVCELQVVHELPLVGVMWLLDELLVMGVLPLEDGLLVVDVLPVACGPGVSELLLLYEPTEVHELPPVGVVWLLDELVESDELPLLDEDRHLSVRRLALWWPVNETELMGQKLQVDEKQLVVWG